MKSTIVSKIKVMLLFLLATIMDWRDFLSTFWTSPKVMVHKEASCSKFVLFVIYQSELRSDTRRFLLQLQNEGFDVVALLTKSPSLETQEFIKQVCFAEIRQIVYGRDFFAYKCGVQFLQNNVPSKLIERVVLINDSIFVSQDGSREMLEALTDPAKKVVGATENYEISRHIGSFCVSMRRDVFFHPRHLKFWNKYRATNVRPLIIKRGEMGLSKVLLSLCDNSPYIIYRIQDIWEKIEKGEVRFEEFVMLRRMPAYELMPSSPIEIIRDESIKFLPNGALSFTLKTLSQDAKEYGNLSFDLNRGLVFEESLLGSQIHQNCIPFRVLCNMPIIKNDLYYRGVLVASDVERLCSYFPSNEASELRNILFSRAPGARYLYGLSRVLFKHGFI